MAPENRREQICLALALLIPAIFFLLLPWNPANVTRESMDHFFGADVWRVYLNLAGSDEVTHYRDKVHPYFSLFAVTAAQAGKLLGIEGGEFLAYRTIFGTAGMFLFWLFIRRLTSPINAFAALALLLSTMTVRIWSTLPESFLFGFFTLMLGLNLAQIRFCPAATFIVTLAGTTTNCTLGIMHLLQRWRSLDWKMTIFTIAIAVLLLSSLQKSLYPTSVHFFDVFALREERRYVNNALSRLPFRAFDFLYSGFVLPLPEGVIAGKITTGKLWGDFAAAYDTGYDNRQTLTIVAALVAITAYLLAGIVQFTRSIKPFETSTLVAGFVLLELVLHLSYGNDPFLYSYHFVPFLIIFMALYLPGEKIRPFLIVLLAICLQEANFGQWQRFEQLFA
jgi:hypothetical protein